MADAGNIRSALANPTGWQSLIIFSVLALAWLTGFSSRLFAVIRFESIIHEFDPWYSIFQRFYCHCQLFFLPGSITDQLTIWLSMASIIFLTGLMKELGILLEGSWEEP